MTKNDMPKDYMTKNDMPKDYMTKNDMPKDYMTKNDMPKDYMPKDDMPQDKHRHYPQNTPLYMKLNSALNETQKQILKQKSEKNIQQKLKSQKNISIDLQSSQEFPPASSVFSHRPQNQFSVMIDEHHQFQRSYSYPHGINQQFLMRSKSHPKEGQQYIAQRYIMVMFQKDSEVSLWENQQPIKKQVIKRFIFNEKIEAQIIRITITSRSILFQIKCKGKGKGGFFGWGKDKQDFYNIPAEDLVRHQWFTFSFLDSNSKLNKNVLYFISTINDICKKPSSNNLKEIWQFSSSAIKSHNINQRLIKQTFSYQEWQKYFKYNEIHLNEDCSRILLYLFTCQFNLTKQLMQQGKGLSQVFFSITNFNYCRNNIPMIQNGQDFKIQQQIIINVLFQKASKKRQYQKNALIQHIQRFIQYENNFIKVQQILKRLIYFCPDKFQQINNRLGSQININNMLLDRYLILKFTLLNFDAQNREFKRNLILQIIKQIQTYFLFNKTNLKIIDDHKNSLTKINPKYELLFKSVFLKQKSNKQQTYLFHHQKFDIFYRQIKSIDEVYQLGIIKYLLPQTLQYEIKQALQFVILDTQSSHNMIAYLCKAKHTQKIIQDIFQKNTKFQRCKLNQILSQWLSKEYVKEQNSFFIKIFVKIMKKSNIHNVLIVEFLRILSIHFVVDQKRNQIINIAQNFFITLQRFPQINDLKAQLIQISKTPQQIRKIYIQRLTKHYLSLNIELNTLQKVSFQIIFDNLIPNQDKQYVIKNLLEKRSQKTRILLKKDIVQYLMDNRKQIKVLTYYQNFKSVFKQFIKDVETHNVEYFIIIKIQSIVVKIIYPQFQQQLKLLHALIDKIYKQTQFLKKRHQSLIKVLSKYELKFLPKIQQLKQWIRNLSTHKVQDLIQQSLTNQEYLKHSEEMQNLMKIPLWKHQNISKINDLLSMRIQSIRQIDLMIKDLQKGNIVFVEFRKYFKRETWTIICQIIKSQSLKQKLKQYVYYLDSETTKHCQTSIMAINEMSNLTTNKAYFPKQSLEKIQSLLSPQQSLSCENAFQMMISIQKQFKQLSFQIFKQDQQILKTIIYHMKFKRVFHMIRDKKIDSRTLLNQLKDYINDSDNCIVKIQDIKELENVVLLAEIIHQSQDFKLFLKQLRHQVTTKRLKLSQNIINIDAKIKQFQQIIDSSANRQTSFKYDLQQIFKQSIVLINSQKGYAHVEIQIQDKSKTNIGSNQQLQKNSIISFKKLTQFKEKAMLLVTDFQKSGQNQQMMKQTIDLFKNYLTLYKIIQEIQNSLEIAIIYGYDPKQFKQQTLIKDGKYQFIYKMKSQIQKLSRQWIQQMKKIYQISYLLTHFMGPRLNFFISQVLSFKFNYLLTHILHIDQKQLSSHMQSLKYMQINEQFLSPIERVKKVCRLFVKYQQNALRSYKNIYVEPSIKNKIQLITCHQIENYYYALVSCGQKPQMNELLYCQNQTSIQQIQIFLKRSIIKHQRRHYFIGIHYLPVQVQLKFIDLLNQYISTQHKRIKFNKCKLCFIDNSTTQKVYLHLNKKQLFQVKLITDSYLKSSLETKFVLENAGQSYLIQSRIAGLGKTFTAQNIKPKSYIVYFPIAGYIDFSRLLQRLKQKKFSSTLPNTLILQLGHILNKQKLQIFLFELIFFKGFNFKQFFFLPKNTTIVVQIQNIFELEDKYSYFSILKIIKEHKEKYIFIDKFQIEKLVVNWMNKEETFTYRYLLGTYTQSLNKQEQPWNQFQNFFNQNPNQKVFAQKDAKTLISQCFIKQFQNAKTQPTFTLYKSFMNLLFIAFKTFSMNGCFDAKMNQNNHRANRNLGLQKVRTDFLKCCIKNCIQFLQATVNTNQFNQNKIQQQQIAQDFRQKLAQFPFLIMPSHDFSTYQFVYLNSSGVHSSIKSLLISQSIWTYIKSNRFGYKQDVLLRKLTPEIVANLFTQKSLQNLQHQDLQREIYRILLHVSGNRKFYIPDKLSVKQYKNQNPQIKHYSLTLDNFFKMCLIIQRATAHVPIVIMGESGVGKTALIRFLVEVVFQHKFLLFNVHAGIDQPKLKQYYDMIIKASNQLNATKQKVWVFFDEFNTTDQLSYIKQMIMDRKFQGQQLPRNVVLLAACNPYRRRQQSSHKRAGIKKKQNQTSQSQLAFKVNPPSLSMIQLMWDYQQLQQRQNQNYISKILQPLELQNHQIIVESISYLHQKLKSMYEISSVSLRDVSRFKQLYVWFRQHMIEKTQHSSYINPNYQMDYEERAVSLSLAFCYSLRIADRVQRKKLLANLTRKLRYKHQIEQVVTNQQMDYVERLKTNGQKVAVNFSLRENVFTTLVCIMNKIPILIIGNPGNSKSLSIRMISSNLRGNISDTQFCKKLPQLSIIYFQGSQACTSQGVEAVFDKAIKSNMDFQKRRKKQIGLGQVENCILFDEIGLAQKSIHNPLKVLHSKLQTNQKQICFVGISNWQLDAAKMSRFLVLSRSNPQKQELQETAIKILQSYLGKIQSCQYLKAFIQMSVYYFNFIQEWDQLHLGQSNQGFFGLRDFYCYIKYVADQLLKKSSQSLTQLIKKSIYTNFDGQNGSLDMFMRIAGFLSQQNDFLIDPIQLVEDNLNKDSSRSLLLIVRGDALLPIINQRIRVKGANQRIQCIYGSTFDLDQQSQEYNSEITSIIITHMSRGTILTFKNPNNSIQTSLYDVFNKSFTISGAKKYCRVAVGANSNPKCVVHQNFGSIVFMDQQVIKVTDLAFLNRFQKHFLTLSNILTQFQRRIVQQIQLWINKLLSFRKRSQFKMQQNYLINSSQQSIVTLIIKFKHLDQTKMKNNIKKTLLKNATQHFYIVLKDQYQNYITQDYKLEVNTLLKQIQYETHDKIPLDKMGFEDIMEQENQTKDMIIFTYDESIYTARNYMYCSQSTIKIRLAQIKSQRQLRRMLSSSFSSRSCQNIHVLIDFHKQFHHINFICFLISSLKTQLSSETPIYIIIKLSQNSLEIDQREHINVSYLMNYQQRFIDMMTEEGKQFVQFVAQKSLQQIYTSTNMEERFQAMYMQAQTKFKLMDNDRANTLNMQNQQIKQFQFSMMMKMHLNPEFRKQLLQFVYQNLSSQKISLTKILNQKQIKKICSSPQQSLLKYLQYEVINLICCFFDRVYQNNLLFSYQFRELLRFYQNVVDVNIIRILFQNCQQDYLEFRNALVEVYAKANRNIKDFNRDTNGILQMQGLCLLPMSANDLGYISTTNASEQSFFKISQKILSLSKGLQNQSIQQCQIQMQKCISILNNKSVFFKPNQRNGIDFQQYLNKKPSLQIFYFFDFISLIYSKQIDSSNLSLQKLVYLFVRIFRKLRIKQKIIFLSLNKQLWSYIFNIWSLWITMKQNGFHGEIQKHYLQNSLLRDQRNQAHQLPKLLVQLCRSTLTLQEELLSLDHRNINSYGIDNYLKYFKKTYFYIQKMRLFCDELGIQIAETMKSTKRFFDLLQQLYNKDQIQLQLTTFLTSQQATFQLKVQSYLSNKLQQSKDKKQTEIILSYLSLDIYSSWIKRVIQKYDGVSYQRNKCIQSFIQYCNRYPLFANNSFYSLQIIFNTFIGQCLSIDQQLHYFQNKTDGVLQMFNKNIDLTQNFSVSLGNYLLNHIKTTILLQQQKIEEQNQLKMDQPTQNRFVKCYFQTFSRLVKISHQKNYLFEIYILQFCKYYSLQYINILRQAEQPHLLQRIDQLLCGQNTTVNALRLYILKNMFYFQKKMTSIKDKYLHRCKWLKNFETIICGQTFEVLVPPTFTTQTKMLDLIRQFRQEQYQKYQLFQAIIGQSFKNPYSKYEYLTFLMNDLYTKTCPQDRIQIMKGIVSKHEFYKRAQNRIQLLLVLSYLNHKITQSLFFKPRQGQLPALSLQTFTLTQLVILNYINMFISCSKVQCPLIEMFFNKNGQVQQKYFQYLENRFLIGGRENLAVATLNGIIQRNDVSSGYYRCSRTCDFFYVIGGTGYGCQNPSVRSTCPWCGLGLGGVGDRLDRVAQGAQKYVIQPGNNPLLQVRQEMRERKILNVRQAKVKLNGYGYSSNMRTMIQQIQDNNRLSSSVKCLVQEILVSVWSFLTQKQIILPGQCRQIFKQTPLAFAKQSYAISEYYLKQIGKRNNLTQIQDNIIWHLGITKQIMQFMINYKDNLVRNGRQYHGLITCKARDQFQDQLTRIVIRVATGNQKLTFVNNNRCIKEGVSLSGQEILRQSGRFNQHLKDYPKIRLIKLLHQDKNPSFENLVSQYGQLIKKQYPLLSYFLSKQEQITRLLKFRKIWLFCTKLLKLFNLKITRREAQTKSIITLYQELILDNPKQNNRPFYNLQRQLSGNQNIQNINDNRNALRDIIRQVEQFCEIWNQLRTLQFQLQYGCHTLGKMNQTTIQLGVQSPILNFLPDQKYKGDQVGERLLSLLQVSSLQHNIICTQLDDIKMSCKKYRQIQIFNKKAVNPTQVQGLTKTLDLKREDVQLYIQNFSNWSVEYGCMLPHYSINKVQALIVQKIVGTHFLNQEIKDYQSVQFIGEQFHFISDIRIMGNQITWGQFNKHEQVQRLIHQLKISSPDTFLRQITLLKGSLQLILCYYRLQKLSVSCQLSVQKFIQKNNIKPSSGLLLCQQVLFTMPLKCILCLYQYIQTFTLHHSFECLDDCYKREKLTQQQQDKIKVFLEQTPNYYRLDEDFLYLLMIALYRFVARSLSLVQYAVEKILWEYLYGGSALWPDSFDLEKLLTMPLFIQAFDISLTKMGSLLQKIPLQLKKTKIQVLVTDSRRTVMNSTRIQPQRIKTKPTVFKRRLNL